MNAATQKPPRASSDARMRAFVAIELSDDAKRALTALIQSLRERRIDGLRLVRPEGMHLTLKFLGDIDASRVPRIAESLAAASARHTPFRLTLAAVGFFPNADRARVVDRRGRRSAPAAPIAARRRRNARHAGLRRRKAPLQPAPDQRPNARQRRPRSQTSRRQCARRISAARRHRHKRQRHQSDAKRSASRRRCLYPHRACAAERHAANAR